MESAGALDLDSDYRLIEVDGKPEKAVTHTAALCCWAFGQKFTLVFVRNLLWYLGGAALVGRLAGVQALLAKTGLPHLQE